MISHKQLEQEINGYFDNLDADNKEKVMYLVSRYHYRTGIKHDDGSLGEIRITPKQLNDLIAYVIDEALILPTL